MTHVTVLFTKSLDNKSHISQEVLEVHSNKQFLQWFDVAKGVRGTLTKHFTSSPCPFVH